MILLSRLRTPILRTPKYLMKPCPHYYLNIVLLDTIYLLFNRKRMRTSTYYRSRYVLKSLAILTVSVGKNNKLLFFYDSYIVYTVIL